MSLAVVVHWRVDLRDTGDYRPYNPTLYVRIVVPSPILHLSRLYGHDLTTRNPWFPGYRSGSDFGRIVNSVSHDSQSDKWSHLCPLTPAVIHGRYVVTHMVHVGCHGQWIPVDLWISRHLTRRSWSRDPSMSWFDTSDHGSHDGHVMTKSMKIPWSVDVMMGEYDPEYDAEKVGPQH